ncbi:MAG: TIGR01777 family oxidoreductase, partial [Gemmatimonadaceae bacterium]
MIVAITGASGFLGSALVSALRADGVRVIRIGRGTDADIRWDPKANVLDATRLNAADAVIHLAGENVGHRWTETRKREIRESRVKGTTLVAQAIAGLPVKPRVLLSASAVGIYGSHRGDEVLTEAATFGADFMARVAQEWEQAAEPARAAGVRVVHLRTGIPLHPAAGVLQRLLPFFSLGVGGRIGSGEQWMSWIARSDWVRAVRFLIDANVAGPVNVVGPAPVTNATFTDALGHVLKRPTVMVVPETAIQLVYGEMGENTILASQRALPERLLSAGLTFEFPDLEQA